MIKFNTKKENTSLWCLLVFTISQIKILKIKTFKQMLGKATEILYTTDIVPVTRRSENSIVLFVFLFMLIIGVIHIL